MAEVEYIFADKTGTLTQNELVFRRLSLLSDNGQQLHAFEDVKASKVFNGLAVANEFFKCVALCQDCMCVEDRFTKQLKYSGSSVDETCLLDLALEIANMGYFSHRSSESIRITTKQLPDEKEIQNEY